MSGRGWIISAILSVLIFGGVVIFSRAFFISRNSVLNSETTKQTLGESKAIIAASSGPAASSKIITATKVPTPSPSPVSSPKPSPSVRPSPNKQSYVIAAFGDSMVDTMGENLDYLDKAMTARFPSTKFKFYNYGIGSQNVVEANKRFGDPFVNKTRNFEPIDKINADIIIVSSFAYNPLFPYDKNAYWLALKEVITKAKATNAQIYLLVEIAPLKNGFGKGAGGVNWDENKTQEHVGYILQNLNAALSLAAETKTPIINAYQKSQVDGKYGNKTYVGTYDGIHPSIEGEVFMADLIAQTLKLP